MLHRYLLTPLAALLLLAAAPRAAQAQTTPGGVRIGTAGTANSKAILDLDAQGKGLLIPRMDSLTRVGIGTPPDGLMVFQTDGRKGFWYAMSGSWLFIPDKARTGDNLGNHRATQDLNLADKLLVGNDGTSGLSITSTGNVGLGTTTAQPATQRLDVRGNLRLGDDGGFNATGTGQALEWVGPGVNTDPVGLYRVNPASDASELRVVVGDGADANDKFVVGRMNGTSTEGGIPTGSFTPTFSVGADGKVNVNGLAGTGTRLLAADPNGNLTATATTGTDGDNLGDHVATQNINLNGNKLVGGTTARAIRGGLKIDGNGLLTLGAPRVAADSTNRYGVRLTDLDQDFIITSDQGKGQANPISVSGAGDRMMWLSYYSAFRAGGVTGDRWNTTSANSAAIGQYSAAFGLDNQAGSLYSTAFGWNNRMRNCEGTLVMGHNNDMAQAFYSVAMGARNSPKGWYHFVGGYQTKVLGSTLASYSASVGAYVPNWPPSFAFGQGCYSRSSRGNTYTMGYYARTRGYFGSFVLADMSPLAINTSNTPPSDRAQDSVYSTDYNQMTMRFAGGYRLFTTVATRDDPSGLTPLGTPIGVQLTPGSNAWSIISDSTKKERRVLADGNLFLARINRMRLGSWNYLGQSPDTMRHYGPMAQDFYAAFGHDGVGRSGNKTTINQADFDGVNLIAIQALYRRLLLLEAENARQQQQIRQLEQARAEASAPAQAAADHAALLSLQAQVARLLADQPRAQR